LWPEAGLADWRVTRKQAQTTAALAPIFLNSSRCAATAGGVAGNGRSATSARLLVLLRSGELISQRLAVTRLGRRKTDASYDMIIRYFADLLRASLHLPFFQYMN